MKKVVLTAAILVLGFIGFAQSNANTAQRLKYVTTGSKTVTVNYDNAGGCSAASATSSTATTVSAPPTVTLTAQPGANACTGVAVTYTTQSGQSNYDWVFPGFHSCIYFLHTISLIVV